jgi:hypothetical protein
MLQAPLAKVGGEKRKIAARSSLRKPEKKKRVRRKKMRKEVLI